MVAYNPNWNEPGNWIERLKKLKQEGLSKSLRVLDPKNDPFWVSPSRERDARWVAGIWQKYGGTDAWPGYDRGIHYFLVSIDINCPWGKNRKVHPSERYMHVTSDWNNLVRAIRDARNWGLMPWDAIESRQSGGLELWINYNGSLLEKDKMPFEDFDGKINHPLIVKIPEIEEIEAASIYEETFDHEIGTLFDMMIDEHTEKLTSSRYQPYYVAVVSEKDGLRNVAERTLSKLGHGFDFLNFKGQATTTEIRRFARWITLGGPKENPIRDKKIRIFYLSDFDYAGRIMVPAFTWKLYYLLFSMGKTEMDVKIKPLALTKEQVEEFDLPPGPVASKKLGSKTLQDRWLREYGKIIEIDSLMGLYPGELENIIIDAISPYIDRDLKDEMKEQRESWKSDTFDSVARDLEHLRDPWDEAHEALSKAVDELNEDLEKAGIRTKLNQLINKINEIKKTHEIDSLIETYEETMRGIELDTIGYADEFEKPESNLDVEEVGDWLFDSKRNPINQADILRKYRP